MRKIKIRSIILALIGGFAVVTLLGLFVLIATDPGDQLVLVKHGVRTDQSGNRFLTGTFHNRTQAYVRAGVEIGFMMVARPVQDPDSSA